MLIRSQDKEKLYPLNHGLYVYGNTVNMDMGYSARENSGDILLGEYETEARSLEVMDEIQKKASQYVQTQNGLGVINYAFEFPKVYLMPEK